LKKPTIHCIFELLVRVVSDVKPNAGLYKTKEDSVAKDFEERKKVVLEAARNQGIVDVVTGANEGISLETVELATELMKKHSSKAYERLERRRNAQK
jgi:hypothetical protein